VVAMVTVCLSMPHLPGVSVGAAGRPSALGAAAPQDVAGQDVAGQLLEQPGPGALVTLVSEKPPHRPPVTTTAVICS
jgi:hypothetical protein